MGFRMLVSGSVRLINRSNQWQFDHEYFQTHKSIFPIYRLITEDGTPLVEIVHETRPLHRKPIAQSGMALTKGIRSRFIYKIGGRKQQGTWFDLNKGDPLNYQFLVVLERPFFSSDVRVGCKDNFRDMTHVDHKLGTGWFPTVGDQHLIGWEYAGTSNRMPVIEYQWQDWGIRFGGLKNKYFNKEPECDPHADIEMGFKGQDSLFCKPNYRPYFNGKIMRCQAANPDWAEDNCLTENTLPGRDGNDVCLKRCFACSRTSLFDNKTGECHKCDKNCDMCDGKHDKCVSCQQGFELDSGMCRICDEHKEIYDPMLRKCLKRDGHLMFSLNQENMISFYTDSVMTPEWDDAYMLVSFTIVDGFTESQEFSMLTQDFELKKWYTHSPSVFQTKKRMFLRFKVPKSTWIFFRLKFHAVIAAPSSEFDAIRMKFKFLDLPPNTAPSELSQKTLPFLPSQKKSLESNSPSNPDLPSPSPSPSPSPQSKAATKDLVCNNLNDRSKSLFLTGPIAP